MNKEIISDSQGISIVALFLLGTASMMMAGIEAGRDIWLAILLSLFFTVLLVLILVRLQVIFPGKNLFEISYHCFGRMAGKVFVLLFSWFAFHAGMLALMEVSFFIITTSLDQTPLLVLVTAVLTLVVLAVKQGIEVMGRAANHIIVWVIAFILLMLVALIPLMDPNNLRPVLASGLAPVLQGAFTSFTFPMGEIILIAMILNTARTTKSNLKIYLLGLLLGGATILAISTASILVLGVEMGAALNYPSYAAFSRIEIGGMLRGAEIFMAIILVLGGFIHLSVFLLGASKGVAALTGSNDYRIFVLPLALFMANLTLSWNERMIEYFQWEVDIWPYYAVPFQVLLPVLILIGAEIKRARQ